MAIENANDHPFKVALVKGADMYVNSHPYQVAIVGGGAGQEARVVDELPEAGEAGYIYLVLKETTKEGDIYDEYLWVLQEDGETYDWEHIGATNEVTITLYDTTGTNTDGAMTQKAVTDTLYSGYGRDTESIKLLRSGTNPLLGIRSIYLGGGTYDGQTASMQTSNSVVIGMGPQVHSFYNVAIGHKIKSSGRLGTALGYSINTSAIDVNSIGGTALGAFTRIDAAGNGSVALGYGAYATRKGEVNVGAGNPIVSRGGGYDNTDYRVIGGVHDGVNDHDAVTVGQLNAAATAFTNAEFNSIFNTDLEEEN